MTRVLIAACTFLVASFATALLVPVIRAVAIRWKLLDYPDGERHRHAQPVPRLGGVAVFAGLLLALAIVPLIWPNALEIGLLAHPLSRAVMGASAILFVIGLLDDLRGVTPGMKLIGQTAAALLVVAFGFRVDTVAIIPGHEISLGVLSIPILVVWLVGVSNAFNLVDGLDGLAGGVGVIALATITASSFALGGGSVPLQSLALAGALVGFLYHNRPPARIFLGDSGSLVVGFLLAVLAIRGSTTPGGVLYALVPIFALSYLLLDTGIAMIRRWLRGAPLSRADGRHIHHQLLGLGLSPQKAVGVIYLKTAVIAILGLCVTFASARMTLAITAIGVTVLFLIFIYGIRWLEYHEFLEAGASFASGVRKARGAIQDRILARDVSTLLKGARSVDEANAIVRDHAPAFRFVDMKILLEDAPAAGTVRAPHHIGSATWLLEYPIMGLQDSNPPLTSQPVLAIWCPVIQMGRPANPERVAQIIAPAIAVVLRNTFGLPSSEPQFQRRARVSGAHYKRRISSEHRRVSDLPG